jgi:hypothetical protein
MNEFSRWASLDVGQKSYTVQVLHWFHYRPGAVAQSWTREEVLTWELVRALDILPRDLFLAPLLLKISELGADAARVARPLAADPQTVRVDPFPSLQLKGAKRNRRSDIGLIGQSGLTLWLELKTGPFKPTPLLSQLDDQREALRVLCNGKPCAVVPLLPAGRPAPALPTLRWDVVSFILMSCIGALTNGPEPESLRRGLRAVARELYQRIGTHPARLLPNHAFAADRRARSKGRR